MTPEADKREPIPLYRAITGAVIAYKNCSESGNDEWRERHERRANKLTSLYMPSGAGVFDSGTPLNSKYSTGEKLVFRTNYNHMNDDGCYDGWTEHTITVRASLYFTLQIQINGRDRNQIKDYLHDVFYAALTQLVQEYPETP